MINFKNKATTAPCDVKDGDAFAVKIVAWVHSAGWAAYQGPSDWSDEQVVMVGDLLSESTAEGLFYVLANSGKPYRWD